MSQLKSALIVMPGAPGTFGEPSAADKVEQVLVNPVFMGAAQAV